MINYKGLEWIPVGRKLAWYDGFAFTYQDNVYFALWLSNLCGWSLGAFFKVVATLNHVGKSFNLYMVTTWDVWIIPSFSNLGLYAAFWAHFMCHHELWPTSESHPFSCLDSVLGLTGGKHYQKITIPIFRLVLQHFAIPGSFPHIIFCHYLFFLFSFGWFVIAVCGSILV